MPSHALDPWLAETTTLGAMGPQPAKGFVSVNCLTAFSLGQPARNLFFHLFARVILAKIPRH